MAIAGPSGCKSAVTNNKLNKIKEGLPIIGKPSFILLRQVLNLCFLPFAHFKQDVCSNS